MLISILATNSEMSTTGIIDILNRCVIGFTEFARNIKSKAGTVGDSRKKGLEQLLYLMFWDTAAIILDVKKDAVGFVAAGQFDYNASCLLKAMSPGISA